MQQTETTDVFVNDQGTLTARAASHPVNWQDDSGTWHKIDPTLVEGPEGLSNRSGPFRVTLPSATTGQPDVRLGMDGWSVAFGLDGATPGRRAEVSGSTARYHDVIQGGLDLEYQVGSNFLKEVLVLNRPPKGAARYLFSLELNGVEARTGKDGAIGLYDPAGTRVAEIPQGFMVDASSQEDTARAPGRVAVRLVNRAAGPAIELVPDARWLAEASYPVRVDPTVRIVAGQATPVYDVQVDDLYPNTRRQYETDGYLNYVTQVGYRTDWDTNIMAYRQVPYMTYQGFNLGPALSSRAQIFSALWEDFAYYTQSSASQDWADFRLGPVNSPWNDWEITWNNKPARRRDSANNEIFVTKRAYDGAKQYIDIKDWVANWAAGIWPYYGLSLDVSDADQNAWVTFGADENGDATGPAIDIEYNTKPTVTVGSPANDTRVPTTMPTLTAYGNDPDPGQTLEYSFRLSNSVDGLEVAYFHRDWSTASTWPVPPATLQDGGTYFWKVGVRDGTDARRWEEWSAPVQFKVNLRLGDQPASPWDSVGPVSVNLANGNLLTKVSSATLPTEGGPLGVAFTYNSRTPTALAGSALPAGWSLSVDTDAALAYERLVVHDPYLLLVEPSGEGHPYQQASTVPGAKSWTAQDDDDAVVTQNGDNSFTVFGRDGLTYSFDPAGRLLSATKTTDRPGTAIAQPYDQRTDPRYWWDGAGRLTKISDRLSGRYLQLSYAGVGPAACDTSGGFFAPPANKLCRIQYYDNAGGLLFETKLFYNGTGDLARIINPGGEQYDFGYVNGPANYARLISDITDPLANDAILAGQRSAGDSNVRTHIDYFAPENPPANREGWVSGITSPLPTTVAGDVRPHRTYDPNVVNVNSYAGYSRVRIDGAAQPNGYSRFASITPLGQKSVEYDANNNHPVWQWLSDDRLQWSDDATGKRTSTKYDERKRPTDTYGPAPASCFNGDTPNGSCTNPAVPKASTAYDGATTFTDGGATNAPAMHGLDIAYWPQQPAAAGAPINNAFKGDAASHEFISPGNVFSKTWSAAPPGLASKDYWVARLTGEIVVPAGQSIGLQVVADDGVRVFVDDQLQPGGNFWFCCPNQQTGGNQFIVTAGAHRLRIDYYQETGPAYLQLVCFSGCSGTLPISYLKPRYDLVTSSRDADGKRTNTLFYDYSVNPPIPNPERGLPGRTIVDPGGLNLETTMTYEPAGQPNVSAYGRLTSKAMPNLATTTYTYNPPYPVEGGGADPCGAPNVIYQNGSLSNVLHPNGVNGELQDYFLYDRVGRVMAKASSTSPADPWNCIHYDDRSRVTWTQDRTGKQTTVNYTGLRTTTSYTDSAGAARTTTDEVDLLGRPYRYTDEHGTRTTRTYDQAGRLIRTDRQYGPLDGTGNPTGPSIAPLATYAYDPAGRQTSVTEYSGGVPRTTTFGYDAAGRLTTTTRPNDDSTLRAMTTQAVAVDGNVGSVTHQRNSTTLASNGYTRSSAGQITNEGGTGTPTRAYTYDGAGRLTKTIEGAAIRNYAYDANSNRCAAATSCATPTFSYNAADQLIGSPYASAYQYDNFGNLIQTTGTAGNPSVTFTYDGNEHATVINDGTTTVTETLAPSGRVLRRRVTVNATGAVSEDITFGYDGPGDSPTYEQPTGTPLGATPVVLADNWDSGNWNNWTTTTAGTATIDVQNNRGRLRVTNGADAKATGPQITDAEVSFTYQFSDRLGLSGLRTTLRGTGSPLQSGYRLDVVSDSSTIRLRRFTGGANTYCATCSFTYTKDTNPQRVRFRVEGARVQVKMWAAGSPEPASWQIDWTDPTPVTGSGYLQLHHNGTTGTREVTVNDLVLTAVPNANIRKTYVTGPGGLLVTDINGEPTYALANAHGDIVGTTDVAGGFTATPIADEFGKPTTGVPTSRLGWLGAHQRYTDHATTGIIRMGVRLYDPNLGRFLSKDPIEGGGCNEYDYACADPVNTFDLDGQCAVALPLCVVAAGTAISIAAPFVGGVIGGIFGKRPKKQYAYCDSVGCWKEGTTPFWRVCPRGMSCMTSKPKKTCIKGCKDMPNWAAQMQDAAAPMLRWNGSNGAVGGGAQDPTTRAPLAPATGWPVRMR